MTKFFKVLISYSDDEYDIRTIEFYFSTKDRAESFKRQFREDLKVKEDWEIAKKYKINIDVSTDICFSKITNIEIFEELMDEEFINYK